MFLVDEIKLCIMLKWFSDISTVLEQIHIFKTSVKAEVTLDVWLRQPESQPWT